MAGFVIEYNRLSGERHVHSFAGPDGHREALRYRLQLEQNRADDGWEIVSLNSDSIETVHRTHARYFERDRLSA
ncbi:hypothetical protein FHX49_001120 [Microbacterium endophyticum]|uniref:DUF4177 domain-containing protein n=1 Tax=Microbacterium endophyticum TaxID=1526412 RepID=A0A7W4V2J4_9MICO|nr:hypothetical protein [Microbacterium endophyticum]MBB2975554.1 hypothetical protein [Microbacterium endophyticum]NIK35427.1 hypothetical protein [Microbacterium endophyticum]